MPVSPPSPQRRKLTLIAQLALAAQALGLLAWPAAAQDLGAVREAVLAAERDRFADAQAFAARARDPLASAIVAWYEITRGSPSFEQVAAFQAAHPGWPSPGLVRRKAELGLTDQSDPRAIVAWFDAPSQQNTPKTWPGAWRYADALILAGRKADADKALAEFLATGAMTGAQLDDARAKYPRLTGPQELAKRADKMLWTGQQDQASALMPYLDGATKTVVQARLTLESGGAGAESVLARVPSNRLSDPGLLFDRMRWRRQNGKESEAVAVLDAHPPQDDKPEAWWKERDALSRHAFDLGDYRLAYRLSADHGRLDPLSFTQSEWYAGWVALRFLKEPAKAAQHFAQMLEQAKTPITTARAGYWLGRAYEALGQRAPAMQAYARAAGHIGTFYGQLASERLEPGGAIAVPPAPKPTEEQARLFDRGELARAARLLIHAGLKSEAEPFVKELANQAKAPAEYALAARLAAEQGSTPLQVQIAKTCAQQTGAVLTEGYPVYNNLAGREPEPAFVYGIIRQESLFDSNALSGAGARGLMQLMPATAKQLAGKLGIPASVDRLTTEPRYNVTLGSAYLAQMADLFGGSYALAAAAYNAGPGRVKQWVALYGQPGVSRDVVDWIESIPITETRNYVQRVMENTELYRARLAGKPTRLAIEKDLGFPLPG